MASQPRIEVEVRRQIDKRLEAKGWILDHHEPNRNVFLEGSVRGYLNTVQKSNLGKKMPDYSLFCDGNPIAVMEAKKPNIPIREALEQGVDYAERIGVDYVFACNGPTFKSLHRPTELPLLINHVEVSEILTQGTLKDFAKRKTHELVTVPERVIRSRKELIDIFETLNDTLRSSGIRAGIDRFSEFANLLFIKLLSERDSKIICWSDLLEKSDDELPNFLNKYVVDRLRDEYHGEVISETQIDGSALKKIVQELNPLHLSDVNEDIKGVAFEHFLHRTTSIQNDLGEYFTPRQVVGFMVRLLNPQFGKTVFDPFCGTGGFLIQSFRHLEQQAKMTERNCHQLHHNSLFGREITKNARIAKMNMILFGDGHSGVEQGDSLKIDQRTKYNYVLSNIPFSLKLKKEIVNSVDARAKDADEACILKCFNSLEERGAMAVVVPDGLFVNKSHSRLWQYLYKECRVRVIASLPRGTFTPYTEAATRIVYLTDKGTKGTKWFYEVTLKERDAGDANAISMEEFLFFYTPSDTPPPSNLPTGVRVKSLQIQHRGTILPVEQLWNVRPDIKTVPLEQVATIRNGTSITQSKVTDGEFPVIAGGRGTIPYYHNQFNTEGGCFTVSKSGAYSGYVWWHETPIWASDCIVIRSRHEREFISFYLYLCMKVKQDEIYRRQQGTGQPHVYTSHIQQFPIPSLSLQDQARIVSLAHRRFRARINAQRNEREALKQALSDINAIFTGTTSEFQ